MVLRNSYPIMLPLNAIFFVVERVLLEGGIPQRPSVFTNRSRDLHRTRTALRSLKDRDGWVILHGMAGCGKTVLAAEALRSHTLLDSCFPGGVFWIRIGQVDPAKLLMRMQNLCVRLDPDPLRPPPRNSEEARDRLRNLFAHNFPYSLLIIDDLWDATTAKYFDIRCRVMATTRDTSVANCIGGKKVKVHVSEGFSFEESKQTLASWTNQLVRDLPPEANAIIDLCRGSPLAISMIGALLRSHPTRWKYYVGQLEKKKVSKLKTSFDYQYPSLSEALAISIGSLNEEQKQLYQDFALFNEESKVPVKVLAILWDEEVCINNILLLKCFY